MLLIRRSAQNFQTSPPRASALEDVVGIDVVKQDDTAAGKRRTAVLEVFLNSFVAVIVVDEDQVDGIAVSPDITLHLRGLRVAEEETPIMAKHEIADLQSPAYTSTDTFLPVASRESRKKSRGRRSAPPAYHDDLLGPRGFRDFITRRAYRGYVIKE